MIRLVYHYSLTSFSVLLIVKILIFDVRGIRRTRAVAVTVWQWATDWSICDRNLDISSTLEARVVVLVLSP